ncbi:prostasin-like [Phymastichus coffea]|uniref:prostasin-like n=1 Tax=Phymastichus coffea TaxID=108790 RepID=UPI00273CDF01|nr:prostasin-like [Phymastichus coffea]
MKILATLLLVQVYLVAANPLLRIAGGRDATPGQFPYQVAIQYGIPPVVKPKTTCGGSIINKEWILTSATCIILLPSNVGKVEVKAGKHENEKDSEYVQTREILLRLVHKEYKTIIKQIRSYDIGLLKLKSPLVFNDRVQPINLPKAYTKPSGLATLTGWGWTSTGLIPKIPKVLQVAKVSIISRSNCEDAIRTIQPTESINDLQFCSGPLDKSISACVADSGDPLVQINKSNNKSIQIGIASWADYPCGATGAPTVYTLVSAFVYWINERINENS